MSCSKSCLSVFTHFDLGCLKHRALLGPSQPCEAAGTHAWNLGARNSWAYLQTNLEMSHPDEMRRDLPGSPSFNEHQRLPARQQALLQAHLSKRRMRVMWLNSALELLITLGWPCSPLWLIFPDPKGAHCHCHKWVAQGHAKCLCIGVTTATQLLSAFHSPINSSIPPWENAEEDNKVNFLWACGKSCGTGSNMEKENTKLS